QVRRVCSQLRSSGARHPASPVTLAHPAESTAMGNNTPITPQLRTMTPADWRAVRAIYAAGIGTGDATFETEPPTWEQFDTTRLADHRYVATSIDSVVGWVAATKVSDREAYRGVVEHSVYVHPGAT